MRKHILMIIGQLLLLVLSVAYIKHAYIANIFPDKQAQQLFKQTECFLVNKKQARFLISYNVNGAQYNRWVSANGLDMSFVPDEAEQASISAQYEIGKTYLCWYDERKPERVILVPRHNWVSAFKLLLPSVFVVILLYSILISIGHFLEERKNSHR